jgi:hypothetical protein
MRNIISGKAAMPRADRFTLSCWPLFEGCREF